MLRLMDIYEIRKHNLVKLIGNQRKGSCAERWGMAPAHLSQILSNKTAKNLGDDVARRIEGIEGLPRGGSTPWRWMSRYRLTLATAGCAQLTWSSRCWPEAAKAFPKKPGNGCWLLPRSR